MKTKGRKDDANKCVMIHVIEDMQMHINVKCMICMTLARRGELGTGEGRSHAGRTTHF